MEELDHRTKEASPQPPAPPKKCYLCRNRTGREELISSVLSKVRREDVQWKEKQLKLKEGKLSSLQKKLRSTEARYKLGNWRMDQFTKELKSKGEWIEKLETEIKSLQSRLVTEIDRNIELETKLIDQELEEEVAAIESGSSGGESCLEIGDGDQGQPDVAVMMQIDRKETEVAAPPPPDTSEASETGLSESSAISVDELHLGNSSLPSTSQTESDDEGMGEPEVPTSNDYDTLFLVSPLQTAIPEQTAGTYEAALQNLKRKRSDNDEGDDDDEEQAGSSSPSDDSEVMTPSPQTSFSLLSVNSTSSSSSEDKPAPAAMKAKGAPANVSHAEDPTKPLSCLCGKSFKYGASLRRHLNYFNGRWGKTCSTCGASFLSSAHFKYHMKSKHSSCKKGKVAVQVSGEKRKNSRKSA